MSNLDESTVRQKVAELRERAVHHAKEIAEMEKTLTAVAKEITATEKATASHRDRLLLP